MDEKDRELQELRRQVEKMAKVPVSHGRLIDADDAVALLRAHKQESMDKGLLLAVDEDAIIRWLDKLPTVIAAEEGETHETD